jgi:GT2 family glycosyltransferase
VTIDLSIIIVNWNSVDFLKNCLTSIARSVSGIAYEVIVIDNASHDGSAAYCAENHPGVLFIQETKNRGFSHANNRAYRESRGEYVLFLNPDTEVRDTAIQNMLSSLKANAAIGAMGCRLLNDDGTVQSSSILSFPTIANQVFDSAFLIRYFGKYGYKGLVPLYNFTGSPVKVDAVSGAGLMVKRNVFDLVGVFSTDYFMYSEDIDLCKKITAKGYQVAFLGSVSISHHAGGATEKNAVKKFSIVMMAESKYRYFRKFRGRLYAWLFRLVNGTTACAKFAIGTLTFPLAAIIPATRAPIVRSIRKNLYIVLWSMGLEQWTESYYKTAQDV